jgi:putative NADH-flavin reductase
LCPLPLPAHLADALSGTDVRLIVVGGAGSLYVDAEHKVQLVDTPDFPDAFKPLAKAQGKALEELRGRDDVRWTFVSPAADFQADGERTGRYLLAGEELTTNSRGESVISYADYAIAIVDEAERTTDAHVRERISVVRA